MSPGVRVRLRLRPGGGAEPVVHFFGEGRDDCAGLGDVPAIAGFGHPSVEGGAQADERFAMLGLSGRGEVLDFVGVGAEVVELFARAGALHELQGRAGEFSLGQELAHERIDRETFFLVAVERGEGRAGAERADVVEARVVHGADTLLGFVDTVACGKRVAARRSGPLADEAVALHQERARDVRGGERGGGEVEEADQLGVDGAGRVAGGSGKIFRPWFYSFQSFAILIARSISASWVRLSPPASSTITSGAVSMPASAAIAPLKPK